MTAFYNEVDPYAAQWLRNLIAAGHIAPGVVDERDIRDIRPDELVSYTQCHFFAGIGVWSHALRRAGWPDDKPIWTGSCPCQPFSAAGKRGGADDERHLWPHWHWLINQLRPAVVLGEQVASKDGLGWLDLVSADLEASGYAFGGSDLCAAGFGGAHIRQRLYFVGLGHALDPRLEGHSGHDGAASGREEPGRPAPAASLSGGLDDPDGGNASAEREQRRGGPDLDRPHAPMLGRNPADWLYCRDGKWRPVEPGTFPLAHAVAGRVGRLRAYGNGLDAETATGFVESVIEAIAAQPERIAA